jgi:DNA-binding PucR family transcriptional regulator
MASQGQMGELVVGFTTDPTWLPSVSQEITDTIHAELPDIDAVPELRASTYASAESVLRLLVDLARSSLPPNEALPPPAAIEYAREFVRRGLGLDSLLRAYHIGQATFFRRWSEQARADIDDPDELVEAIELGARWTFEYVEALSQALVRRYADERERWVRSAAALRAQIVDALLEGELVDPDSASRRLGYELSRHHLAFVLWVEGFEIYDEALAMLERAAIELVSSLGAGAPLLVPRARLCLAGWVGWRDPDDAPDFLGARLDPRAFGAVLAAAGSRAVGVTGFARSHGEAMRARRLAQLAGFSAGSVTRYEDVALAALASEDLNHAREFVQSELGPLIGTEEHLLRLSGTLRVYLEENMSPLRAAQRLGVHEHTVSNRIRSAQELLPRSIDQRAAELMVALRLVRLAQPGRPTAP